MSNLSTPTTAATSRSTARHKLWARLTQRAASLAALGVVGWLVWRARPAALERIRITSITPGDPPVAHVAIAYGSGARPISMIIEIQSPHATGSATVNGITLFATIPLDGSPDGPFELQATAYYRAYGFTQVVSRFF
jgi:hypothetical protein